MTTASQHNKYTPLTQMKRVLLAATALVGGAHAQAEVSFYLSPGYCSDG